MTNVEENIDSKGFSNILCDKICSFLTVHIHGESRKPQGYLPMYHTEVATVSKIDCTNRTEVRLWQF